MELWSESMPKSVIWLQIYSATAGSIKNLVEFNKINMQIGGYPYLVATCDRQVVCPLPGFGGGHL